MRMTCWLCDAESEIDVLLHIFPCPDLSITVGMGKTIMLSALIHTNKEPEPVDDEKSSRTRQVRLDSVFRPVPTDQRKQPKFGSSATLIVAPTSLLSQWSEELQRSSAPGTLRVTVWHGQNRLDIEALNDDENDKSIPVVITSYGVLASEHSKFQKAHNGSSIFQGQLHRLFFVKRS